MKVLSIDIETYSSADLGKSGVYKYTESPDFEVLLFSYAIDYGQVHCVDLTERRLPDEIVDLIKNPYVIKTAYNATFERICLSRHLKVDGYLDPTNWRCTQVQAMYNGLPASLENAGAALGHEQKDKRGKELIAFFSMPRKQTNSNQINIFGHQNRNLPDDAPDKWEEYKQYNIQDVVVEMDIAKRTKPIPAFEQSLYELDQAINDRGLEIDLEFVKGAIQVDLDMKDEVSRNLFQATGLDNPKSNHQFKKWVEDQTGRTLDSIDKKQIESLKKEFEGSDLAAVLSLKQQVSKTSTTKYGTMIECVCSDQRVRGLLQFYGANRTGRWAGRLVQVHNLPQNHLEDLEMAKQIVMTGDYPLCKMMYGNMVQNVLSELIRTSFVAGTGKTFVVTDFSAIEARVLSWFAGEKWRMEVFATHGKIYEASASQMFGVPIDEITKGSPLRQKGKIAELALGYQGSVGALKEMGADAMGLTEEELPIIVDSWRRANPRIVALWNEVNLIACNAVQGIKGRVKDLVTFERKDGHLIVNLPSGRQLYYRDVHIVQNRFGQKSISYKEKSSGSRGGVMVKETYGGKLVENIIQAMARDCLALAMRRLNADDELRNTIVMHVHDEVILEVPEVDGERLLEKANNILKQPIPWANGLQLKGDGYVTSFYKKD